VLTAGRTHFARTKISIPMWAELNEIQSKLREFTDISIGKPHIKRFQVINGQNGRIHNNDEGRWQHPELTGQRLRTKTVTSQFKHSPTSTPEHPSSWITGGCQSPLLEKYWRGRDLNPGLLFTWETLYQLSYWPRRQKWVIYFLCILLLLVKIIIQSKKK
jgi:hypothetical protein